MTRAVDIEGRGVRVNGRSVGVGSAIPDDGLSGYSVTDPDNTLDVTSTSITISGSTINTRGRVYNNIKLSDYDQVVYKFDFNMSECDKGQGGLAWGPDADVTRSNMTAWAGVGFNGTPPAITIGNSDGGGQTIANFSLNTDYTLQLTWDLPNSTLDAELFDSNGTSQETASTALPSTSYDYFYAFQQREGGASFPGVLSGVFDNVRWESA